VLYFYSYLSMKIISVPWADEVLPMRGLHCLSAAALLAIAPVQSICGQTASPASGTGVAPAQNSAVPSFFTSKTRLWNGRSQIICFQLPQPAIQDQTFPCKVDDKLVQVLMPPRVLAGEKIGYLRVQSIAEGKTQLDLDGAKLDLDIVKDPAFGTVSTFNLRIISPVEGASVWGDFSVGVEQMTQGNAAQLPMPVLRLSNGKEVAGHRLPDTNPSQYGRWVYDIKAGDLSPGDNELVATTTDRGGRPVESNSVELNEVSPDPSSIMTGVCKDADSPDHPPRTGGGGRAGTFKDEQYGDVLQGICCLPLWITKEQEGEYQMVVTTRGELAGDGLPTYGMSIDEDGQSGTGVELATTEWRRLPLGHPIFLTEGGHMLNIRPGNRGLLQKYELARLDAPVSGSKLTANGGEMGDTTLPMTGSTPMNMMAENRGSPPSHDLHIVFTDNLDGQTVAGPLDFGAQCFWPNQNHSPPPKSELYVNNQLISSQATAAPHFTVNPSSLVVGKNTLQLRAVLPSGREARSAELAVEVPRNFPLSSTAPPQVSISYAPQQIATGKVDAVVAQVMDSHKVAAADLVIDDQPQHLDQTPLHGLGSLVFPVLTRNLAPGQHHLKVIAHDNQATSSEMTFTISDAAPATLSRYQRAVFLLDRFGYGPEPGEIAEILTRGETAWLQSRISMGVTTPGEANEQEWLKTQYGNMRSEPQLVSDAIQYLLTDSNPVRAHFLMWTENHFSTWLRKDGLPAKSREHASFLKLGPAPFFDLLFTSATSPAMLVYLDQSNSFAHRLNENYAREIMELHTLGVKGGYTQTDVTTLAGLLAGWTMTEQAHDDGSPGGQGTYYFGYDSHLNEGKACRIFGMEFPPADPAKRFDRVLAALEMLSAHPSCAQFISRKLCEEYVSDPAPPALVDALSKVYLETGGDVSAMLVAMAQHPDFWAAPLKVANPIDFSVRDSRLAHSTDTISVDRFISQSGMGMFDRATPDGYPADDGYSVNTNALMQRWRFSKSIQIISFTPD
jgi:hypothetical protein